MVSISSRLRDDLEYEDIDISDPRFSLGFSALSLEATDEYDDLDDWADHRPWASSPDPSSTRRKRRQRRCDFSFDTAPPFHYRTVADGSTFRLCVLLSGTGTNPVECRLVWETYDEPQRDYLCLSYCWETVRRDAAILVDGFRFRVTNNLLLALQSLRKPTMNVLIWIDQICINQDDNHERAHQVSIMKYIFSRAKEVVVWLGEADDRSEKLCEYARRMKRGDDKPPHALKRVLGPRQLHDAIQKLLQRPWFTRVWVLPEVALAHFTTVAIGRQLLSWDNLVRLIRDVPLPSSAGFDKQTSLLGNPRQRIAILTQMRASQRHGLPHTDITQLLILAKASKSTDLRDLIYSFYGITLLTTDANYECAVERLYSDVAHMYITSISWQDSYSCWHALSAEQHTQQLMSILYSAGALHQHHRLSSWVPDWSYGWHLTPVWCKPTSNLQNLCGKDEYGKDEWTSGIRSEFRAGGHQRGIFEIVEDSYGSRRLHLSAYLFDVIDEVNLTTPVSTPGPVASSFATTASPSNAFGEQIISPEHRYGRVSFVSKRGFMGVATEGVAPGDVLTVLIGGDVPVVLRRQSDPDHPSRSVYELLCECAVECSAIMEGVELDENRMLVNEITLI